MVMDSLRYWVDALPRRRLPLRPRRRRSAARRTASIPARASSTRCARTRCCRSVKLISEPWDIGPGGYQLGNHPPGFAEWNDRFRDGVRRFWRGDAGQRRTSPRGSPARATSSTTGAAGPGPRSTTSPRTTASPCATWSATPSATTRPTARTTATATTTTTRPTGASKARPTIRRSTTRACRVQRALLATRVPGAGHADAAGRRRVRPHPERQQQRLLPGQRDLLARLEAGRERRGPALTDFVARRDRAAPSTPGAALRHASCTAATKPAPDCSTSPGSTSRARSSRPRPGTIRTSARWCCAAPRPMPMARSPILTCCFNPTPRTAPSSCRRRGLPPRLLLDSADPAGAGARHRGRLADPVQCAQRRCWLTTAFIDHDMPSARPISATTARAFACGRPSQRSVAVEIDGRPRADDAAARRLVRGRGAVRRRAPATLSPVDRRRPCPIPPRARRPTTCTAPSLVVDPGAYAGAIPTGAAGRGTKPCSTSCTSAPVAASRACRPISIAWPALGITAIELMPISDFPGTRNWGYDGVLPFAPDRAYGTPDELKALIDAAHERRLMVFLDVVYNHFGPDGNYLGALRAAVLPQTTSRRRGARRSISASRQVRRYFIENALYWLTNIASTGCASMPCTPSPTSSWLDEMAAEIRRRRAGRHVHLVLEHDGNEADHLRHGLRRAVERRCPSRAARAADRRKRRLLQRLCRRRRPSSWRAASPKASPTRASRRPIARARRAARRAPTCRRPLRAVPAEPRPDRQSPARRPADGDRPSRRAEGGDRAAAARARTSRCCSWARSG